MKAKLRVFVFLIKIGKEFDESGFILAAVGKQFKIVALFAQKLTEGDILAQRALEVENVAVLALEIHITGAVVDDLADFFDFFDVSEFHVHCLPCNFFFDFRLQQQYTRWRRKIQGVV